MINLDSTRHAPGRSRGPAWQQNPRTALLRNPAELAQIAARIQRGERTEVIASELGVTANHICGRLRDAGLSIARRGGTARQRVREKMDNRESI